ncbi:MAG TPA: hypothetical protein VKM54_25715 [Myxococcota bacterium]|nr:hypothetical protein [Myxococcota bacterium]
MAICAETLAKVLLEPSDQREATERLGLIREIAKKLDAEALQLGWARVPEGARGRDLTMPETEEVSE